VRRLSGHRLGLWLALPAIVIGYLSGLKRSYYRHSGYLDNGAEPLYAGYKDDSAPYFVKHAVSSRSVAPRLIGDAGAAEAAATAHKPQLQ